MTLTTILIAYAVAILAVIALVSVVERNSRNARPRTSHHATPCARPGCCDADKIETPLHARSNAR